MEAKEENLRHIRPVFESSPGFLVSYLAKMTFMCPSAKFNSRVILDISWSFLQRQKAIDSYHVKKFVKESQ